MKPRSLFGKFLLMQALYTATYTSFSSFAPAYLCDTRALSDSQASLLLMLFTIGAFLGEFCFSRLCDRLRTHRKVFLLCCALIAPVALALYFCPASPLICLLYPLLGFCETPLFVVLDTWFLDSFPGDTGLYGKILAGGAVAYALLSFGYSKLLDAVGYGVMLVALLAVLLAATLLARTLPDASSAADAKNEGAVPCAGSFTCLSSCCSPPCWARGSAATPTACCPC